jgi:hypothetical protein
VLESSTDDHKIQSQPYKNFIVDNFKHVAHIIIIISIIIISSSSGSSSCSSSAIFRLISH